ncbi:hypothetical protein CAEBREN_02798 [Caenorhabditis brenneri]|uniref:Uncharacterized protein n=1 Tax=Caenorhabditis brenneri TaxID=135651 RepID=G0NF04_CAEBE|nr:hypothetical protein CAEBREN_02798 [Caenorhabditis brenneri]
MNDISINGDPAYLNYKFDFLTVPVLAACVPIVYLFPTIIIVLKIIQKYVHHLVKKRDERINHHVFTVIVTHLVLGFCYMLADYTSIRIPATGLLTTWCASQEPNHGLKLLFLLSVYFNYTAMLFPFLLSVLRLVPIYYPLQLDEICSKIVRISIPVILVYPIFFCFPLIPAVGDCRQLLGTYQFGGIYFYYRGAWFEVKQAVALVLNSAFWLSACLIANAMLSKKLKKMRNRHESSKLQRAELSLTLITISMFPSYITNFAFLIGFLINPVSSAYLMGLRPFGSDCEFVFVAWIFYLTHPIFKVHKVDGKISSKIPSKEDTKTKRFPTTF